MNVKRRVLWHACLAGLGMSLALGCVTTVSEVKPLASARLVVSRAGQNATLQFASEKGVTYQVLYAPTRGAKAQWKPLPGAERIRGTGQLFEFKDYIPYGEPRFYRLKVIQFVKE